MYKTINLSKAKNGIDHIQIDSASTEKLGRILAPDHSKRFFIPRLGYFSSPIGFVKWLNTGKEEDRYVNVLDASLTKKHLLDRTRSLILYGKYYQLQSLKSAMIALLSRKIFKSDKLVGSLPLIMYKKVEAPNKGGTVTEVDQWLTYARIVSKMANSIVNQPVGQAYPYSDELFTLEEKVILRDVVASMIRKHPVIVSIKDTPCIIDSNFDVSVLEKPAKAAPDKETPGDEPASTDAVVSEELLNEEPHSEETITTETPVAQVAEILTNPVSDLEEETEAEKEKQSA